MHDENFLSQARPGAILNASDATHKIAKIVTLSVRVNSLEHVAYGNMRLLVDTAREWVSREYDGVCDTLAAQLELMSHSDLLAMPDVTYSKPTVDHIGKKRQQP